jgi:hypothetical protein
MVSTGIIFAFIYISTHFLVPYSLSYPLFLPACPPYWTRPGPSSCSLIL